MPPHRQMFSFDREESDLPPQIPNHLLRNGKGNKKNVRIRSLEDQQRRRPSNSTQTTRDDNTPSQRSTHPPIDLLHRPLWNYQNPKHREYVPNSKRDPFYDKRHRQQETSNQRNETTKKSSSYNRWNSDSELQHEQREKKVNLINRTRSTGIIKQNEPTRNVFKEHKPRQEAFVISKTDDDQSNFHPISSLDKYEHFTPYIRTDEVLDPAKAFSPVPTSRETSAHRPRVSFVKEILFTFVFSRQLHMMIIITDKLLLYNHRLIMCLQLDKNIFFNN